MEAWWGMRECVLVSLLSVANKRNPDQTGLKNKRKLLAHRRVKSKGTNEFQAWLDPGADMLLCGPCLSCQLGLVSTLSFSLSGSF